MLPRIGSHGGPGIQMICHDRQYVHHDATKQKGNDLRTIKITMKQIKMNEFQLSYSLFGTSQFHFHTPVISLSLRINGQFP